jgi:hypothetical protein
LSSINVIKDVLVEFEELSGLKANPSKSSFYCSRISKRVKHTLLNELQMKEGSLPVRYLRVPLISSKLSSTDCRVLLERIKGRIIFGYLEISLMQEGCNCSPLFYIACKYTGQVSSFSLRKLLSLLNRNLIGLCGMGRMLRLQRQKWPGLIFFS